MEVERNMIRELKPVSNFDYQMNSNQIFSREFLEIRAKILQIAASLDRMDRAEGECDDPRKELLGKGLELLTNDKRDKAVAVQLLFSRDYQEGWRKDYEV